MISTAAQKQKQLNNSFKSYYRNMPRYLDTPPENGENQADIATKRIQIGDINFTNEMRPYEDNDKYIDSNEDIDIAAISNYLYAKDLYNRVNPTSVNVVGAKQFTQQLSGIPKQYNNDVYTRGIRQSRQKNNVKLYVAART